MDHRNVVRSDFGRPTDGSPLLGRTDHDAPSVFRPENMLREARRQKGLRSGRVPPVCVLDPDGDVVRLLHAERGARRSEHWACYHTEMWEWEDEAGAVGIVGNAVGGSFAVLVAEQLFASGCEFLVNVSSAGQIAPDLATPAYVLIDRALRDEGTSHHYLPTAAYVEADPALTEAAFAALRGTDQPVLRGATWTTDAPFRETEDVIALRRRQGILTVEMEAASLLAFGRARDRPVVCLAHVTNQLGCVDGDFEKGEMNGAARSLQFATTIADACHRMASPRLRSASAI